jgi:hypothetical protein
VVGGDLLLHEAADGVAEGFVILFKQGARYRQHGRAGRHRKVRHIVGQIGIAVRSHSGGRGGYSGIGRRNPVLHLCPGMDLPTVEANHPRQATVEFQHRATAGLLVQAVDVLGHDQADPPGLFQLRQGAMADAGSRLPDHRPAVEAASPVTPCAS